MGFIYKYRPCNEFTKAIFTTGCLHYSHPCDFNDPYDCMFYLNKKKLHIFIERIATDKIRLVPIDMDVLQQIVQNEINDVEVCCFSKDGVQMQMWSHYAKEHKGICLEFEEELLLDRQYCEVREVIYQQEQVINESILPTLPQEEIIKFLYTKHSSWDYEQEVRFFHKPDPIYSNGNYPFNKKALKSVYFGSKCTKDNIEQYIELCKSNGFAHVRFYQMELTQNGDFGLLPRRMN